MEVERQLTEGDSLMEFKLWNAANGVQVTFAFHRNTSRKTAKEVKQIAFVESDISHTINEDTERRFLWAPLYAVWPC